MINVLFKFSNIKPNHRERALKNIVNSIFPNNLSWHILNKVNVMQLQERTKIKKIENESKFFSYIIIYFWKFDFVKFFNVNITFIIVNEKISIRAH